MRRLLDRAASGGPESGLTLIELLVASAMGIAMLAAIGAMVIGTMRSQPDTTEKAQNIATARSALERLTREIRNGVAVDEATADSVSFRTYLRRSSCGGAALPSSSTPAVECQVTYSCEGAACSRTETAPGVAGGTPATAFSGLADTDIFSYSPNTEEPSFIEVTLRIPDPKGGGDLTVSDGASLRNAILEY